MSNINWIVRIKNKNFWLTIIPAVLLLVQVVAAGLVNAAFSVLVILGVVNDPTTAGISDSKQAMTYNTPKED
jgi:uncharacterized membrane protein